MSIVGTRGISNSDAKLIGNEITKGVTVPLPQCPSGQEFLQSSTINTKVQIVFSISHHFFSQKMAGSGDEIQSGASIETSTNAKGNTTDVSIKRKPPKERSPAWKVFVKFKDADGNQRARCKYCGIEYPHDSKERGTTNLLSHIKNCKKKPVPLVDKTQTQLSFQQKPGGEKGEETLVPWIFDQGKCRKALVKMIIVDEQPFSSVEKEGFRNFLKTLQPLFQIPSRTTVTRDCFEIYKDERQNLRKFFTETQQRICITTDTWTSIQKINYMCVTAHFIDKEWTLHKRILNFLPITSHKGVDLGQSVSKCLLEWGLENLFTVTVDNASSNDKMVEELSDQLSKWNKNIMGGEHLYVRCMAHIINLIVQDGMKDADKSVERIRAAIRYIRQSPARLNRFKECCELEKIACTKSLCLDVPTRWNSTYLMLSVAEVYESAFTLYGTMDYGVLHCVENYVCADGRSAGPLLSSDWENARRIVKFLEVSYELTFKVSGSRYVTSNLHFLDICVAASTLNELKESDDVRLQEMATRMREKFDKYWGDPQKMNKMICISCVLDPRHKIVSLVFALNVIFGEQNGMKIADGVKAYMSSLFNEYKKNSGAELEIPLVSSPTSSTSSTGTSRSSASASSTSSKFMEQLNKHKNNGGVDAKTELDKYLDDDIANDKDGFDILLWWKVNSLRYPVLAEMARDVLAIPISSVASECALSTGGRILDPFRSSLTPRLVQALVCAQDWYRSEPTPISVEEDLDNLEKLELDWINTGREPCIIDM